MIERYARSAMRALFSDQHRYDCWLKVEQAVLFSYHKAGLIDDEDYTKLKELKAVDGNEVAAMEEITRHDVVAFTRVLDEKLGKEKKWIHFGLTSTDIVDTAYALIYQSANQIIEADLIGLMKILAKKANAYKSLPCIGRTHGMHGEVTSFGLKWVLWYDEASRHLDRFKAVRKEIEVGKISGAMGNFANVSPAIQDEVCSQLNLGSARISTQVLQRDRHAHYLSILALIGSFLEKIAVEIRHLSRSEVGEVSEYFSKGQKGSSAMPHKHNPIASENICGCARVLRGYMSVAYENIALWHERDISHSSSERIIIPDALMLLDYMLHRYQKVLDQLLVYPEQMQKNLNLSKGVIFSQQVLNALILHGLSRSEAYDLIQPLAAIAYEQHQEFYEVLLGNPEVRKYLMIEELKECFNIERLLVAEEEIYRRVKIDA
ncbi:MAG: adenylosuccinate lyase [Erysipelotrichaceae bacterium]|jgi:adenylosuccinate lyase|nr:adenylosuccinate lyase [Erysipelotrichaceae bacterium]